MSPREALDRSVTAALRAILYLRISDLTDTSTSITRQEKAGRGKAEDLRADVVKVFKDEDKSGYHPYVTRPDWDAALAMLRNRLADILIVFKVDRATRQGIPQASEIIRIVYETGCRFISIADGIDSNNEGWELQLTIAAHQAHRESKNTATRVADLRADERDAGRWMGHRPYGFLVTPERKLELHPEESEIVRAVINKLLSGKVTLRAVAKWLNDQGYDSPRWASRKIRIAQLEAKSEPLKAQKLREKPMKYANSWSWPTVRQLVVSPTLAGFMPHQGEIYRHSKTGEMVRVGAQLIDLADHVQLQSMYGTRVPVHFRRSAMPGDKSKVTGRPVTGLLSDFLHCAGCGSRMSYDTAFVRRGEVWPRYRCTRRLFGGRCPGVLIKGTHADALVTEAMMRRLGALDDDDPALLAIAQRWADLRYPDRKAIRARLEALVQDEEKYLDRLEEEKLSGLFSGDRGETRFRRRYEESNARLAGYERELAELPEAQQLDNIAFLRDTHLFAAAWESWPPGEKREILGLILERAWVIKARKTGVRPTIERFRFWWVGEEEPEGIGAATMLGEASKGRADA
ncbi:recombinase family protein [Streptomyces sp. NBC_01356]|uniref:recombinase family protein n=1 Tax=Streptomyces sp. NBC_01356 TaxID=2903836 RepID=UPI002E327B4F|nr:recombinase family protein [Streptomyces sp. NBC_01356]